MYYLARGFLVNGQPCCTLYANLSYMDGWVNLLDQAGSSILRSPLRPLATRKLRFVSAIFDFPQIIRLIFLIRRQSPSLVIVNRQYDEDNLDAVIAAIVFNPLKVISVIHMPMTESKNQRPLGRARGAFMKLFSHTFLHHHVFSSQASLEEFSAYYYSLPRKYLHVIPSGVFEPSDLNGKPHSLQPKASLFRNNLPTVGFIGQFNEQKNIFLVIDSWRRSDNAFNLLLAGEGPLESQIREYMSQFDSSKYYIMPWSDRYRDYLLAMDLFVMPSLFEGLPLTLIEALGLGVPSITTPFNGTQELIAKCHWLKASKDFTIDSFLTEINHFLSGCWCPMPTSRELMSFKENFSVNSMSSKYTTILRH